MGKVLPKISGIKLEFISSNKTKSPSLKLSNQVSQEENKEESAKQDTSQVDEEDQKMEEQDSVQSSESKDNLKDIKYAVEQKEAK